MSNKHEKKDHKTKESWPRGPGIGIAPGRGKTALPPQEARIYVVPGWPAVEGLSYSCGLYQRLAVRTGLLFTEGSHQAYFITAGGQRQVFCSPFFIAP